MDAEKYVNQIARRVKCCAKRRREFRQQLLSDISCREEGGETLTEILKSMGSPREVAREFNQNLPAREKRRHRIKWILIWIAAALAVLAVVFAVLFWMLPKGYPMGSSGIFSEEEIAEEAKALIELFDAEDYQALREHAEKEVAAVFSKEQMDPIKQSFCPDWGRRTSFGTFYVQEVSQRGQQYAIIQINVSYENTGITYTMMFDEAMKLTGFYIK